MQWRVVRSLRAFLLCISQSSLNHPLTCQLLVVRIYLHMHMLTVLSLVCSSHSILCRQFYLISIKFQLKGPLEEYLDQVNFNYSCCQNLSDIRPVWKLVRWGYNRFWSQTHPGLYLGSITCYFCDLGLCY